MKKCLTYGGIAPSVKAFFNHNGVAAMKKCLTYGGIAPSVKVSFETYTNGVRPAV